MAHVGTVSDVVLATLQRVKACALAGQLTDENLLRIEREIRTEYGGREVYIAASIDRSRRDALYVADLESGMSVSEVAAKHGVSTRTIIRAGKRPRHTT